MRLGLALLRIIVGVLFVGHGAQKVLGKFGGHGPDGTGGFFESLGLRPGKQMALAAGGSEMAGGGLLALGLLTPVAQAMLTGVMSTAIWTVHREKGPWVSDGGYEYNLALIAMLFAVTDAGPGRWSLDAARGREQWGAFWALTALAAGVGGTAGVLQLSQGEPQGAGPIEAAGA